MKFQGLYTAIVTPFAGNRVDEEAFRMLVEAQIAAGVAGIVAVGTTGEFHRRSYPYDPGSGKDGSRRNAPGVPLLQ